MKKMKKWLAGVLCVVMIATVAQAPLTVAAAATPKLHTGNRTIYVGKIFDYNVINKIKGSKYQWTSSDTKVATVNNTNGVVTGKKAGKTTITLKVTVNKKTYTSKAVVTVKESATKVEFANGIEGSTIGVGKNVFKYTRKLTTKSGGPCTDKTYMSIIPETNTAGATVDGYGRVSTTKAGSFEIIAQTAVTRNQYNLKNITATSKTLKVQVPLTVSTELTAVNKVKIITNSKMASFTTADFKITNTATKQVQKITNLEVAENGLSAIATISSSFQKDAIYNVEFDKLDLSSKFTAAYGDIDSIVVEDQQIPPGVATAIKYQVLDENGIDVTINYPYNKAGMEFNIASYNLDTDGKLTLPAKGLSALFTVEYVTTNTAGKIVKVTSNRATVTAVDAVIAKIKQYAIAGTDKTVDWSNPVKSISIGETGQRFYIQYENVSGSTIDSSKSSNSKITFTSADKDILGVELTSGNLYPYKEGTAEITVTDGNFKQTFSIKVGATKIATSLVPSTQSIKLSSQSGINDTETIRFDLRDQYGNPMTPNASEYPMVRVISGAESIVTVTNSSRHVTKNNTQATNVAIRDNYFTIPFKALNSGNATLQITYAGQTTSVQVTVAKPGTLHTYKPFLSSIVVDPNVLGDSATILRIYGVDVDGIKINMIHEGTYSLTDSAGKIILSNQVVNLAGKRDGDTIDASVLKLEDGVYTVTITVGPVVESTTFTVRSSTPAATVNRAYSSLSVSSGDDIFTKILECLPVHVNGSNVSAFLSNATIEYTSYNETLLPSRTVSKGSNTFQYANYTAEIRINKIKFTFGSQQYEINPNANITFTTK